MDLTEAGASGSRRDVLQALLVELTTALTGTEDVRTKAALAAQIRGTSADLAALEDEVKVGDPVDEIARRRAARGAGAAPRPGRTSGGQG